VVSALNGCWAIERKEMISLGKSTTAVLTIAILTAGLPACQKSEDTAGKGPAEKAGAAVDRATAQAGEKVNKAGEQVGQAMQKAGEKGGETVQKAGEKMEGASQDAQKPEQTQKKE
jgi:hypothetical protein